MSTTSGTKSEGGIGEAIRVVIHALIIAAVIRTLLFQPFNIPSGSMESTLLVGDYLFVSKYSYGYSHYSLPFSPPLFSGRVFGSAPARGDVVVFRFPREDNIDYIKRVIGLPGETIELKKGELYVNGEHVEQQFDMTPNETDFGPFTVPEGHYFVMGDNRNNSKDSRSPMVGALERRMIKGHVRCVVFPLNKARILGE